MPWCCSRRTHVETYGIWGRKTDVLSVQLYVPSLCPRHCCGCLLLSFLKYKTRCCKLSAYDVELCIAVMCDGLMHVGKRSETL